MKTLWQGKWISVVSPDNYPYEMLHEPDVVFVIPVYKPKIGFEMIGMRKELCPPYLIKSGDRTTDERFYTVISGKVEEAEIPMEAAFRELREEAGIIPKDYKIISVGPEKMQVCKSTDMRCTVLMIEIYEYEKEKPHGDGTKYEKMSKTIWVKKKNVKEILEKPNVDFLLWSLMSMLFRY